MCVALYLATLRAAQHNPVSTRLMNAYGQPENRAKKCSSQSPLQRLDMRLADRWDSMEWETYLKDKFVAEVWKLPVVVTVRN